MIEIKGLKKSFGDLQVLKGIDLRVQQGEVISIIGASGSGKSTLLYCINGLEAIQGGQILVDWHRIQTLLGSRCGFVDKRLRLSRILPPGEEIKRMIGWGCNPHCHGSTNHRHRVSVE